MTQATDTASSVLALPMRSHAKRRAIPARLASAQRPARRGPPTRAGGLPRPPGTPFLKIHSYFWARQENWAFFENLGIL